MSGLLSPLNSAAIVAALGFTPASAGAVVMSSGTAGSPGMPFGSESTTGFYRSGVGQLGVSILGGNVGAWSSAGLAIGVNGSSGAASLSVGDAGGLYRAATGVLGVTGALVLPTEARTISNAIILGAASVVNVNKTAIETSVAFVNTGGSWQGVVPLQVNQWNPGSAHFEPLIFFKSRGATIGSTGVVQAQDNLGLIQFNGDDGAGPGNVTAINVEGSVSALYPVTVGNVPGRFRVYLSDNASNLNAVMTLDADQSATFSGAMTVNGVFQARAAGQVLPVLLNTTQVTTLGNVSLMSHNALDSNGSQATFGAIKVTSGNSVTHGSHTGVLALRVAQGGALVDGLTITGGTSSTAVDTRSPFTALSNTAIPAGGTSGAGIKVSSTANFGVFFGSGAPSLSAAKGSLYLRSDGTTTNNRAYINTDGSTTWTALTTVA